MSASTFPLDHALTYLAEGAANIVYRIVPLPPSPGTLSTSDSLSESYGPSTPPPTDLPPLSTDPLYENKLLRLRKALPNLTSVLASQKSFEQHIAPLLPTESLVEQTLVKLPSGLIARCNGELRDMESTGARPGRRHGTYLADEEYGSIVTDMSAAGNPHASTLEFKPKWLAQSPSAPEKARRCRTCALQLRRRQKDAGDRGDDSSGALPANPGYFCPLRLMTSRSQDHAVVAERITSVATVSAIERARVALALAEWIEQAPLLRMLRDLQVKLDQHGVFQAGADETQIAKLAIAMTWRDCTVFLKMSTEDDALVEARLGDLDVKSGAKLDSWAALEKALINEGWYTDDVVGVGKEGLCVLEDPKARGSIIAREHDL